MTTVAGFGPSFFAGGDHQMEKVDIHSAGRDVVYANIVNVNLPAPDRDVPQTYSPAHTDRGLSREFPRPSQGGLMRTLWRGMRSLGSGNSEDISKLSSIEGFFLPALSPRDPSNAETYIQALSRASTRGLPCWQPMPSTLSRPGGAIPCDVGTFSADDGFKRMFNLKDDVDSIRETGRACGREVYGPPSSKTIRSENALQAGDTVSHGVQSKTDVEWLPNGARRTAAFEFTCEDLRGGAMLALTSPVSLVEATHQMNIRDNIIRHAELLYRHAESIMGIGPDESLYVITGCLKSDGWALAAYRTLFGNDQARTARLTHIGDAHVTSGSGPSTHQVQVPIYDWKERGPTEAKRGQFVGKRVEDQSLFFRGFRVTFSRKFVSRIRKELSDSSHSRTAVVGPADGSPCTSSPESDEGTSIGSGPFDPGLSHPRHDSGRGNDTYGWRSESAPSEGPEGVGTTQGSRRVHDGGPCGINKPTDNDSPSQGPFPPDGVRVETFPEASSEVCHPCDWINKFLLDQTGADIALSHDDDWRFHLAQRKDGNWNESMHGLIETLLETRNIFLCNGIAFLEPAISYEAEESLGPTSQAEDCQALNSDLASPNVGPNIRLTLQEERTAERVFTTPVIPSNINPGFRTAPQSRPHSGGPSFNYYRHVNSVFQKLFGGTANLEYGSQESTARPPEQRWAMVARIVPRDPIGPPSNIGLGYGSTSHGAKEAAARNAYAYFLKNYSKDLWEEGLI